MPTLLAHPLFISASHTLTDSGWSRQYAEKQLSEGLENYFTNPILYQEEHKIDVNSNSGHKADSEP